MTRLRSCGVIADRDHGSDFGLDPGFVFGQSIRCCRGFAFWRPPSRPELSGLLRQVAAFRIGGQLPATGKNPVRIRDFCDGHHSAVINHSANNGYREG